MSNESKEGKNKVYQTSLPNKFTRETSIRPIDIHICRLIGNGKKQKDIAEILEISKGYVSRRVKKLIKVGLLTPGPRSSCATYSVNHSLLEQVYRSLTECEAPRKSGNYLIDCHNYKYKFEIEHDNPDVIGIRKGKMKNWSRDPEYGETGACEWRRTTKHVEFWLTTPVVLKTNDPRDLERLKATNQAEIKEAAREFQNKYGIKLKLKRPIPVHKEIKVKSKEITELVKGKTIHDTVFKAVYPDDPNIEFKDEIFAKNYIGSRSVENKASSIMRVLREIQTTQELLVNAMNEQTNILKTVFGKPGPRQPTPDPGNVGYVR